MLPVRRKKQRFKTQTVVLKQPQIMTELEKKYFGEDNNFIDYFMEIGAEPHIFKDESLYEMDSVEEISKKLSPKIITKFPNFDKRNIVVENTMIQQIFPRGFKAVQSDEKPTSEFYCVVMDNQLYSAVYTSKYLACFVVYEDLESYKALFDRYKLVSENSDYFIRNNSYCGRKTKREIKTDDKNFYIPKCLCIVSVHPCIRQFEIILRELYCMTMSNQFSSLFIENIIEKLIIQTPKIPRGYKNVILKFPNNEIDLTQTKMNEYPSVNIDLAKIFSDLSLNNILEIYKFLLYETKLVFFSEDLYSLTNAILSFVSLLSPFKYQFQVVSVLPANLYKFMETISPFIFGVNEKYEEDFTKKNEIVIEDTICFIDIDKDNYYIVAPGAQINPKEFPEIPKNLKDKLEVRINKYHQELQKNINNISKKEKKIDKNKNSKSENVLSMKESLRKTKKLDEDIICYPFNEEKNKQYQLIFYDFMIDLLKDYPQFLSKDYSVSKDISMSTRDMIDLKSYLNLYNNTEKDFYGRIFNTQMFIEFIYKRMMPKDYNEKVEVLFFEEKINEKIANKKIFSKSKMMAQNSLLPCKDYDYENEKYIIDLTPENNKITKYLLDYIVSQNPLKNIIIDFLENGYIVSINENKKKLFFEYYVFPSLLSEKIFILNIDSYSIPENLCQKINLINNSIVNKSHLKFIHNVKHLKNSVGQNDLYICYLIIWSMVLWYTDENERDYRFLEMLEILEKIEEHDMKTFELLFKVLQAYSNDENIILLYRKFIHYRLNPSWDIFSIVSKIIKKKQNANKKNKLLQQGISVKEIREQFKNEKINIDKSTFRERVFKVNKKERIFSNNIVFSAYLKCSSNSCKNSLNLQKICSDLNLLKTEKDNSGVEKIKCLGKTSDKQPCTNYIESKLRFRFGEELFNQKLMSSQNNKMSTSINKNITFMSPSEIKRKLLEITLFKKKSYNLDVDNFRFIHPEIFWNIIWYFDLFKIDITYFLPYDRYKKKNYRNTEIQNHIKFLDKEKKIVPYNNNNNSNETNKEEEKKNALFNDKDIKVIDLRKNKNNLNLFNKNNIRKMYVKDDLCFQQVFQFSYLTKIGMVNCKNPNSYEKNIAYNEIPLIMQEQEEISSSSNSLNNAGITESTPTNLGLRESTISPIEKRNSAIYGVPLNSMYKSINSSMISNADSNISVNNLNKTTNGEIHLNTYLMFEESDNSSLNVSASSGSESNSED